MKFFDKTKILYKLDFALKNVPYLLLLFSIYGAYFFLIDIRNISLNQLKVFEIGVLIFSSLLMTILNFGVLYFAFVMISDLKFNKKIIEIIVKKVIKWEPNQKFKENEAISDELGLPLFNIYYELETYTEIMRIEKLLSKKIFDELDDEKVMYLFKSFKFNIKDYEPQAHVKSVFDAKVLRIVSRASNMKEYESLIPSHLYRQLRILEKDGAYSLENIKEKIYPLKLKDIPPEIIFENNKINLNYLMYLFLIPNRKKMTIDGLRKIVNYYPEICFNMDLLDYYKENELSLPYTEERCIRLINHGLDVSDLLKLAYLQKMNIPLQYPEKPKNFKEIMIYIVEKNSLILKFFEDNDINNFELKNNFHPYTKISGLQYLANATYKEYTFKVIENSFELSELGSKLNNCVGEYPIRGHMAEYQIISVEKDKKPVYCVSICIQTKKIDQIKGKSNSTVFDKGLKDFIQKTISKE